ncbi:hypothetical protein ACF3NT_06520 [Naumannella halotolerans]|uniref:hypothetical protein n=1 Tax=Naumannella halotolerans TaxID=993414 RepID=UPI00370D4FF4
MSRSDRRKGLWKSSGHLDPGADDGVMTIPERPRLNPDSPILQRPDGTHQVGLHHRPVLLPARLEPLLLALDGRSSPTGLAARTGLRRTEIELVLQALAGSGHLTAGTTGSGGGASLASPPPVACGSVILIGSGVLVEEAAHLLRQLGRRARLLRHPRRLSPPDPSALGADPGLCVLALGSREADRAVVATVHATGHPYLLVDSASTWVRVGPLVLPAITPCPRCADLHRRDHDPDWPWLAAQLARPAEEPGPGLRTWALGQLLTQSQALAADRSPFCLGASVELDTSTWLPTHRRYRAHPDCPCGASE